MQTSSSPSRNPCAIVGPDDLFPNITGDGAKRKAEELGFKIAYTGKYPKTAGDLSSVATQLKAANADIVLATGYVQDSILLVKSLRELQVSPKIVGLATAVGVQDFREALGPSAEAIMGVDYWVPTLTYKDPVFGDSTGFAKAFEQKYSKPPTYHAASGAATGVILQLALQKAGTTNSAAVRDRLARAAGRDVLRSIQLRRERRQPARHAQRLADHQRPASGRLPVRGEAGGSGLPASERPVSCNSVAAPARPPPFP